MSTLDDVTAAYHQDDLFSTLANADAHGNKHRDRARIRDWVRAQHDGATCDEIEAHLGLSHQTASARCTEMRRDGTLYWDGTSRRRTRTGSWARVLTA